MLHRAAIALSPNNANMLHRLAKMLRLGHDSTPVDGGECEQLTHRVLLLEPAHAESLAKELRLCRTLQKVTDDVRAMCELADLYDRSNSGYRDYGLHTPRGNDEDQISFIAAKRVYLRAVWSWCRQMPRRYRTCITIERNPAMIREKQFTGVRSLRWIRTTKNAVVS